MTSRRTDPRIFALGRMLENAADLYPDFITHLNRQIATYDGWAQRGDTVTVTTSGHNSVTEVQAEARNRYRLIVDDVDAGIRLIGVTINDVIESMQKAMRGHTLYPTDQPQPEPRCNGTVDPTCTNIPSTHHHPATDMTVEGMCDDCWLAACPICKTRAAETKRGGRCEACYRRELRKANAA